MAGLSPRSSSIPQCFNLYSSKLPMKNPLLALLQRSTTTLHLLQIHAQMVVTGFISDPFAASRLLLASVDSLDYAELLFYHIPQPNTFSWNALIRAHACSSNPRQALVVFTRMHGNDILTDNYTYPFVLKACGLVLDQRNGEAMHGEVMKRGFNTDLIVKNSLINMYCKCGELGLGRRVFDEMDDTDLVSWNTMINGYVAAGEMPTARTLFDQMPERDVFSWAMMIDGYGKKVGEVAQARLLFDQMPVRDVACWNSMISSYISIGDVTSASELFQAMPVRNLISWSIMIEGYARYGRPMQALNLFAQMLQEKIAPDKIAVVGVLMACAQLGALDQGSWLHMYIKRKKVVLDMVVQTTIIDMYMKCGRPDLAKRIFDEMPERNVVTWNVMITGLGINGCGKEALKMFNLMEQEGKLVDDLIFLGVLCACSHAGLVNDGLRVFERMKTVYGHEPKVEHYGCLVDLLARAGQLDEAKRVIDTMPLRAHTALWGSLLAACKIHHRVDLAEISLQRLAELKSDDCSVYILMSNMYADAGMWEKVSSVREVINIRGMKKETGGSVIEIEGRVCEFDSRNVSHILQTSLHVVLWNLSMISKSAQDLI